MIEVSSKRVTDDLYIVTTQRRFLFWREPERTWHLARTHGRFWAVGAFDPETGAEPNGDNYLAINGWIDAMGLNREADERADAERLARHQKAAAEAFRKASGT